MEQETCEFTKPDGAPCRAKKLPGMLFCWSHEPSLQEARAAARAKGGANSAAVVRLHKALPPALKHVYDKLGRALDEVHAGTLPASTGQALASIARAMMTVIDSSELSQRVQDMEQRLGLNDKEGGP